MNKNLQLTHETGEQIACSVQEIVDDAGILLYQMDSEKCNELHPSLCDIIK